MSKLYAQFDEDGICFCVGSPKTDVEATFDCLGKKYINGQWVSEEEESESLEIALPD